MPSTRAPRRGLAAAPPARGIALPLRALLLAGASLVVAAATFVALPRPTFTATAVIGIEGGQPTLRPAMVQAAQDAAVSRSVVVRAAAGLATAAGRTAEPATSGITAAVLSAAVRAQAGDVRNALVVHASDADGERAAAMASAVATALVAELGDRDEVLRRQGDATAARRLAALRDAAEAAQGRLAALGGDAPNLGPGHEVASRVDALSARLDAIRAILASGTPPLGAGRDLPPGIEALQSTYLDLSRQLARASETLGDRHTTVIGLRDGMKRTSAELVAAWARLAKATETELADAKRAAGRGTARDAEHAAALAAARLAARSADAALARAQAPADDGDVVRFRLVAPAPVPVIAEGLDLPTRLGITGAAGLAGLAAAFAMRRRRQPLESRDEAPSARPIEQIEPSLFESEPAVAREVAASGEDGTLSETMPEAEVAATSESEEEALPMDQAEAATSPLARNADLTVALAGALPGIAKIVPRAEVTVVMVATNEAGVGTMDAGLALAAAAARAGRRVLVVEGEKARPALAAAVEVEAEPAIVEIFGGPRIVLRAEAGDGLIYLAPSFRGGARLAADLADAGDVLVADALADEFDLVIVDGDRAAGAQEMMDDVDAVLRVGRFASARDDAHFLSALGWSREGFLGTIIVAAAVFVPSRVEPPKPDALPLPRAPSLPRAASIHPGTTTGARRPIPIDNRRRAGSR